MRPAVDPSPGPLGGHAGNFRAPFSYRGGDILGAGPAEINRPLVSCPLISPRPAGTEGRGPAVPSGGAGRGAEASMRFRSAFALVLAAGLALLCGAAGGAAAAEDKPEARARVPVETFTLDNGMTFLLVRRPDKTTVTAGWVAH